MDRYLQIGEGDDKAAIDNDTTNKIQVIDAKGHHVLPGFIDIHIHGGYGQDAMDGSYDGLKYLSENLLSEGTTSYLATTMTAILLIESIKHLQILLNMKAEQDVHNAAEIVRYTFRKDHLYLKIKLVLNIRNTLYAHLSIKLNIFRDC